MPGAAWLRPRLSLAAVSKELVHEILHQLNVLLGYLRHLQQVLERLRECVQTGVGDFM